MKTFVLTALAYFSIILSMSSQPDMTIWRLPDGVHHAGSAHSTPPELFDCGSYYFFFSSEKDTSVWSIKNEGNENLILDLPLTFAASPATSITISKQPVSLLLVQVKKLISN